MTAPRPLPDGTQPRVTLDGILVGAIIVGIAGVALDWTHGLTVLVLCIIAGVVGFGFGFAQQ